MPACETCWSAMAAYQERVRRDSERHTVRAAKLIADIEQHLKANN